MSGNNSVFVKLLLDEDLPDNTILFIPKDFTIRINCEEARNQDYDWKYKLVKVEDE